MWKKLAIGDGSSEELRDPKSDVALSPKRSDFRAAVKDPLIGKSLCQV